MRSARYRRARFLLRVCLLVLSLILLSTGLALAAPEKPTAQGKLAAGWKLFHAGDHAKCYRTVEPMLQGGKDIDRAMAYHLAARALWEGGSGEGRAKARQIWGQLDKLYQRTSIGQPLNDYLGRRLEIGKAVQAAGEGKAAQAVANLKRFYQLNEHSDEAVAEALLELARIQTEAHKFDEAEKALTFAKAYLLRQQNVKEIPEAAIKVFLDEIPRVRARLEALRDKVLYPGKDLFLAAEKLRQARKYKDAIRAYYELSKQHPDTPYAHHGEYLIGVCWRELDDPEHAVRQWEKFAAERPDGPYRGQAYIGMMDLYLKELLDLEKAGEQGKAASEAITRVALLKPPADDAVANETVTSWKSAAMDLHMRVGIVAFLGADYFKAIDAFGRARKLAERLGARQKGPLLAVLDLLIEATKQQKPIIPQDAGGAGEGKSLAGDKNAMALSLARMFHLTGRRSHAEQYVDNVLGSRYPGRSTAQRSYAIFLKSKLLQASGKADEAKAGYQKSIKEFPKGTWHDESLFQLAAMTEADARRAFPAPKPPAPRKDKDGNPLPPKPLTPQQRDKQRLANQERQLKLLEARAKALPLWKELIQRYPASDRAEEAMFRAGTLLADLEQWGDAIKALDAAVKKYPKSILAGAAYVRLIDIHLEQLFEIAPARKYTENAINWLTEISPKLSPSHEKVLCLEIYLRAGTIAYLGGQYDKAVILFGKAGPTPPPAKFTLAADLPRIGVHFLKKASAERRALTPEAVCAEAKTDKQRIVIQLADIAMEGLQFERAESLFNRILEPQDSTHQVGPNVEAYCISQMGRSIMRHHEEPERALQTLTRLKDRRFSESPWAGEGLFRLAVFTFNQTQKPEAALPLFQDFLDRYPDHPEAERAMFYCCLIRSRGDEGASIQIACRRFLQRYPDSRFAGHIERILRSVEQDKSKKGDKQ